MLTTSERPQKAPAKTEPKGNARWAGGFYAALAFFGAMAHFYIRGTVYKPGDAAATAAAVAENVDLVRLGVLFDLVGAAAYLFLALALHRLFRHLQRDVANVMVILVAIGAGITTLNMVFQVGAILTATDPSYTEGLGGADSEVLTLLLFDLQYYGYILLQVFTGLWLIPLGFLALRSNGFPRPLCWLLMLGSLSYLGDLVLQVQFPAQAMELSEVVLAPVAVVEAWMIGYLCIRGVGRNFKSELARTSWSGSPS